jgi:hypothetical protein
MPAVAAAKPRSRVLGRLLALIVLATFLLLLGAGLYFNVGAPAVAEPFEVQRFASISVPDEKNAIVCYRRAAPDFVDGLWFAGPTTPVQRDEFRMTHDASAIEILKLTPDAMRRWLDANRPAMETWKQGSQLDDALDVPPNQARLTTPSSAAINASHEFSRLALVEAAQLTAHGKAQEAWGWYRAVLRTSRHVGMRAAIIPRLVGCALHATAAEAIIPWSARPELTAADLRKALSETQALDAMTPPASECLKVEYLSAVNGFDENLAEWKVVGNVLDAFGARARAHRSLNLIFANWLGQVDRPLFERTALRTGQPDLYELAATAPAGSLSAADLQREIGLSGSLPDSALLKCLVPSPSVVNSIDREQARRAALILALALQLYAREHGELPSDLGTLVQAGYLKSIPPDPFGKGEPLHYRRAANPTEGLLWSVWTDLVDQDGKIPVEMADGPGDKCFVIRVPAGSKHKSERPASVRPESRSAKP